MGDGQDGDLKAPKKAPAAKPGVEKDTPETGNGGADNAPPVEKDAATAAAEARADEIVDGWVNGTLRNGKVARSTEAWNAVNAALPALKAALVSALVATA